MRSALHLNDRGTGNFTHNLQGTFNWFAYAISAKTVAMGDVNV